jgi:hypothetical protein
MFVVKRKIAPINKHSLLAVSAGQKEEAVV